MFIHTYIWRNQSTDGDTVTLDALRIQFIYIIQRDIAISLSLSLSIYTYIYIYI